MAQQQAMFFDVISSMKRATARRDDASESDESITAITNRGNKLKRKAKFVQQGRLAQADGPSVYKRRLAYNGYHRNVISKIAARVDPDGDIIDDEENSDPELSPAEDDPYADVKLESLLMPLTNAADLDKHPSMSVPYTSQVLEEMAKDAQDMLHREEHALWRIKQILTRFRGDDGWAPCGMFETTSDPLLLQSIQQAASAAPSVDLEDARPGEDGSAWDAASQTQAGAGTYSNGLTLPLDQPEEKDAGPVPVTSASADEGISNSQVVDAVSDETQTAPTKVSAPFGAQPSERDFAREEQANGQHPDTAGADLPQSPVSQNHASLSGDAKAQQTTEARDTGGGVDEIHPDGDPSNALQSTKGEDEDDTDDGTSNQAHRMTTRARAQAIPDAVSLTSQVPEAEAAVPIHPFFVAPLDTLPFRAQGLVAPLSDDIRLVLSAYAQRQEEVVRQCAALLSGLRRALYLKHTVWSWCRNEGHVGEMSDGEDWIDLEQWGLDEPLKKGEEVEDEEVAVGLTKKTRNRRAAA